MNQLILSAWKETKYTKGVLQLTPTYLHGKFRQCMNNSFNKHRQIWSSLIFAGLISVQTNGRVRKTGLDNDYLFKYSRYPLIIFWLLWRKTCP